MRLSVINILLIISFLTTALLSSFIIFRSRKNLSVFLSFSAYGAAIWILAMIIFLNSKSNIITHISAKTLYIAGAIIVANFIFFTYIFYNSRLRNNKKLIAINLFLFAIFCGIILSSDAIISGVVINQEERKVILGSSYFLCK